MTNGGKTTLAKNLQKHLPNCYVISQDDFFKVSINFFDHLFNTKSFGSKVNSITSKKPLLRDKAFVVKVNSM